MKTWALTVAVAVLILVVAFSEVGPVRAAAAILVLDHGFGKNYSYTRNGHIILTNRTSTFTQDDPRVYAYLKATFYSANLTWSWYDPSGQLYDSSYYQANCVTSPCDEQSSMRISGTQAATRPGVWRMDFLADGDLVYSDYFTLIAIVTQENFWNFTLIQSANPRIIASLRVVIHPNNSSWSSYKIYMPYASNVTAYDYSTNQSLGVTDSTNNLVVVDLGGSRADGYSFVMKFDVSYVVQPLGAGNYALNWREYPWERFNDVHRIPETFNVTFPEGVALLDIIGYNSLDLSYNATEGTGVSLDLATNGTARRLGWTILYRAPFAAQATSSTGLFGVRSEYLLPILPLSVRNLSVWSAVMSVFLLTASELMSPVYSRGGYGVLINRKRLRLAALLLVAIFMITVVFQLTSTVAVQR